MKKIPILFIFLAIATLFCAKELFAGPIDVLVAKLEQKGILTHNEAVMILRETEQEITNEINERIAVTVPEWTQRMTLSGDVRYRNQFTWSDIDNTRYRQRIRARMGLKSDVNDQVEAGIRLAVGNDNPVSTNVTLGDFFGSKGFMLDRAYIAYTPDFLDGHVTTWGGIFERPFYGTELLWDSDLSFGGAAINAAINTKELSFVSQDIPSTDLFFAGGSFPLDEVGDMTEDPWLMGIQGGFASEVFEGVNVKSALTFYNYTNVKEYVPITHRQGGNTNAFNGGVAKGFRLLNAPAEIGIDDPLRFIGHEAKESSIIPYLLFYSDFVNNLAVSSGDTGYMLGAKIGHKKVKAPKSWELAYDYRYLGQNAQLDVFPDSDGFSPGLGYHVSNIRFNYAVLKNTVLCAEWYYGIRDRKDEGDTDKEASTFILDAKVKF